MFIYLILFFSGSWFVCWFVLLNYTNINSNQIEGQDNERITQEIRDQSGVVGNEHDPSINITYHTKHISSPSYKTIGQVRERYENHCYNNYFTRLLELPLVCSKQGRKQEQEDEFRYEYEQEDETEHDNVIFEQQLDQYNGNSTKEAVDIVTNADGSHSIPSWSVSTEGGVGDAHFVDASAHPAHADAIYLDEEADHDDELCLLWRTTGPGPMPGLDNLDPPHQSIMMPDYDDHEDIALERYQNDLWPKEDESLCVCNAAMKQQHQPGPSLIQFPEHFCQSDEEELDIEEEELVDFKSSSSSSIWPVVELHENPLNCLPLNIFDLDASELYNDGDETIKETSRIKKNRQNEIKNNELEDELEQPYPIDSSKDTSLLSQINSVLTRSQLLSLDCKNQDKRAAIKLVSKSREISYTDWETQ